jgi:hypothetical protein
MRIRKEVAALAVGATLLASGALVTAQSASAASGDPGKVLAFSNIYSGPGAWYSIQYTTTVDGWIPLQCYTDTQDYVPNGPWHRWFKFNQSNSYVRSDRVNPQPSVPHC